MAAAKTERGSLATQLRVVIAHLGRRLRQEAMVEESVTPSQYYTLVALFQHGPLTQGELAAVEHVQAPAMSRIVSKLEEGGLVTRTAETSDRRCLRVALSDAGRAVLDAARVRREAYMSARVAALTPAEQEVLEAALPVLERLLDDGEAGARR